ncbi:hypothetical protein LTR56_026555 [Elasticomyces elasticus]|nr:hypothetical protein LTR56_026555 [Elasticomyces elasticus]KAK3617709.1 hypothetical protein LTR22_026647 [Elasticomyces elasticus]KAK4899343.1 hypothetical protein LTR49_027650 [Elasticomyces elasticus]
MARRLVKDDLETDGAFLGSQLSERWEDEMMGDCCGVSVLGWAMHEDAKTLLSGLWPMLNPHPLHGIPFSDLYWCRPVISMHKTSAADMIGLWRWEESRRDARRPLLYADLPEYLNLTTIPTRYDWNTLAGTAILRHTIPMPTVRFRLAMKRAKPATSASSGLTICGRANLYDQSGSVKRKRVKRRVREWKPCKCTTGVTRIRGLWQIDYLSTV